MKRIVFDTNILIQYLRDPDVFADALASYDVVALTPTDISFTFRDWTL